MKNRLFFYLLSCAVLCTTLIQINCMNETEDEEMTEQKMLDRGKYLVTFGSCDDCHTPKIYTNMGPVFDTTKTLSGHPANAVLPPIDTSEITPSKWVLTNDHFTSWVGPWGISYAANLTPDRPTGIGTWTSEIFIGSMRSGKHMGVGRPLLPPMPYFNVAKLTDEDLKAIFTYLQSIPPIHNQVPEPVPPNMISQKFGTSAGN
jgi:mono/diheme cytochrome c family protein